MFSNYKIAALLSGIAALITIPLVIFFALIQFSNNNQFVFLNSLFILIQTIVIVYVILYLKNFLEEKIGLNNQKTIFLWICILIVFINAIGMVSSYFDTLTSILILILAIIPLIPLGVLYIIIGMRILKIKEHNVPHLKIVAYFIIIVGYLNATIIFSDLALLVDFILNIFLVLMFLKADNLMRCAPYGKE